LQKQLHDNALSYQKDLEQSQTENRWLQKKVKKATSELESVQMSFFKMHASEKELETSLLHDSLEENTQIDDQCLDHIQAQLEAREPGNAKFHQFLESSDDTGDALEQNRTDMRLSLWQTCEVIQNDSQLMRIMKWRFVICK
jgi:hypothetical protein